MADFANAPRAFIDLHEWLIEKHFTLLMDVPGGAFNQYLVMSKGPVHIAVRADRGGWELTLSLDEGDKFWQVDQLEAYLDGHPWIGEPATDDHQAEFVRLRLDDLVERWRQNPGACAELYKLGDEWMRWRFGIPIPEGGFWRKKPC